MTPLKSLIFASVLLLPSLAIAENLIYRCAAPHFVRNAGPADSMTGIAPTELHLTVITFQNADLENAATIERLTWRDADGIVRHDSGPKISVPHPFVLGRDITTVPPGGAYNMSTTSLGTPLWFLGHPSFAAPPPSIEGLFVTNGSLTIEVSKAGDRRLFVVHARETSRERIVPPPPATNVSMGVERSSQFTRCFRIRDRDDD